MFWFSPTKAASKEQESEESEGKDEYLDDNGKLLL